MGRFFLIAMIVSLSALALFGIVVGTGLITNGDRPAPVTMDEFLKQHQK